jgi:hypothetical protein
MQACNDSGYCLVPAVLTLSRYLQLIEWQVWESRRMSREKKKETARQEVMTMMGWDETQT